MAKKGKTAEDEVLKIEGYRHKETLPLKFHKVEIEGVIRGLTMAIKAGEAPKEALDNYVHKVLLEGRADAGTNGFDRNNKVLMEAYNKFTPETTSIDEGIKYGLAYREKMAVAKRLNIPFEEAWNGAGKSYETGRTGKQHAQRSDQMQEAVNDPRNKELNRYVKRVAENDLTPVERAAIRPSKAIEQVYGLDKEHVIDTAFDIMQKKLPINQEAYFMGIEKGRQNDNVSLLNKTHKIVDTVLFGLEGFISSKLSKLQRPDLPAKSDPERSPYTQMQYDILTEMADPVIKLIQEQQKSQDKETKK